MEKIKVPESQIEDLVKSGDFSFAPGQRVNVINPAGETVSLPSEELKDALNNGYQYETAFGGAVREKASESKGFSGAIQTFAAQAADEALMGIPEMGYDKLGDPFKVAVKNQIKKDHAVSNTLGGLAGFGASLLYGGPIAKIANVADRSGLAAQQIVARNLQKVGIERGSKSIAKDILARTAANATKFGVEGVSVAAPIAGAQVSLENIQAVNEDRIADYDAAAESLLLGGGLGMAFGVVSGPTGALFSKLKGSVNKATKDIAQKSGYLSESGVKTAPNPETGLSRLDEVAANEGMDESVVDALRNEIGRLKKDAPEILEASKRIGIDPTEGMLSDSIAVQRFESALQKKASFGGIEKAKQYNKMYGQIEDVTRRALGVEDFDMTRAQVGGQVKQSMRAQAQEAIDRQGAVFNELRLEYRQIPVDIKPLKSVSGNIRALAKKSFDPQSKSTLVNVAKFIDEGGVQNLDDVKNLTTNLYSLYSPNKERNQAITEIIKKLKNQEEKVIDRAIKTRIEAASVPGAQTMDDAVKLQGLYDDMQQANAKWAELAESLAESADDLSLGNIKGPRDFVDKLDSLTNEQVVAKMIPKNDMMSLQRLQQKNPEQFKLVGNLTKARLLDQSRVNDQFSIRSFLRKYSDMEPEMRLALFGDDAVRILDDVRLVDRSVPRDINPSGTASALGWTIGSLPDIVATGITEQIQSFAIKKAMNVEGVLGVESRMGAVSKSLDRISDWFRSGFKAASPTENAKKSLGAIVQLQGSDDHGKHANFAQLQQRIGEISANPQASINEVSDKLQYLSESGAPRVAESLGKKMVNTVAYLEKVMPKGPTVTNPFNRRVYQPTDRELSAFERKLSVAIDPFVALDAFTDKTLTADHVESLAANYPKIYSAVRKRILDAASEDHGGVPYSERLRLSLLLGIDIDQSTSPEFVLSFQDSFAASNQTMNQENAGQRTLKTEPSEVRELYQTSAQRQLAPKT
jgi:hypothetical protein